MYFAVDKVPMQGEMRARITLGGPRHEYSLTLPWSELRDPKGRELITSWAVGIFTITESGIAYSLVDQLLDYLEQRFPLDRPLIRRPPLGKWFKRLW